MFFMYSYSSSITRLLISSLYKAIPDIIDTKINILLNKENFIYLYTYH